MFTPTIKLIRLLAAVLAASISAQSIAATIDVDTVLDASNPFFNESLTLVDGTSPPTRLTVLDGALVTSETLAIDAYGSSIIDMRGGSLSSEDEDIGLRLNDDATLVLSGGRINTVSFSGEARDRSRIELRGGEMLEGFRLLDSSRMDIVSGRFDVLLVAGYGNSRTVMTGGSPSHVRLFDDASFVMHAGILPGGLVTEGSSRALLNGGSTYIVQVFGQSELTVRGGVLIDTIVAADSGIIRIYGTGLHYAEDDDNPNVKYIRGTLADGTELEVFYRIRDQGQIIFHEVPEPTAWSLLTIGAAVLTFVSRRSRSRCGNPACAC
ncbi:MAG: PEP-CTERM sorting domain-containing protein [Planctomycetia bacterium]|nr:PEP-CTERM sorting domain-containing protein [Planctomycetia bacterium]